MNGIKIFLLGFGLWYVIQFADMLLNLLNSYINVIVAKNNNKISQLSELEQHQTNMIGFQYQPEDEWEDD